MKWKIILKKSSEMYVLMKEKLLMLLKHLENTDIG